MYSIPVSISLSDIIKAISINTSNIRRRSSVMVISALCIRTNVANDQHVTASAYVACVYAYVAGSYWLNGLFGRIMFGYKCLCQSK